MNKEEIIHKLSEKSFLPNVCVYCDAEMYKGYFIEDNIGRALSFPKYLLKPFVNNPAQEMPIHFKCIKPFIYDLIREGGTEDAKENMGTAKIIIRN